MEEDIGISKNMKYYWNERIQYAFNIKHPQRRAAMSRKMDGNIRNPFDGLF